MQSLAEFCIYNIHATCAQVRDGLFNISKKILGEDAAIQCMLQLEAFRRREGCFGSKRAVTMAGMMPAHQWWGANVCNQEAKELKTVALKVSYAVHMFCLMCSLCHDLHCS